MERRSPLRTHLAVVVAALVACRGSEHASPSPRGGAAALTVSDDAGRLVALAQPARRFVSLSPAVTELLFALGVGDRVVGRTTWCDYPPVVRLVPSVGDGLNPSLEAIAARRPDLVVLYRSPLNETAAAQLSRLGIAAVVLRQDRLEDVARAARLLGRLVGRSAAGDSLADSLSRLLAAPAPRSRRRLAFVVWDSPPIVIGAGSYLDQLATLAGAENVFHDIGAASAAVALETIVTRDPDVIVVVSDSVEPRPPALARRPEWRVIRAVRGGRFVYLVGSLFGRPGPRAGVAAAELRRLLGQLTR